MQIPAQESITLALSRRYVHLNISAYTLANKPLERAQMARAGRALTTAFYTAGDEQSFAHSGRIYCAT